MINYIAEYGRSQRAAGNQNVDWSKLSWNKYVTLFNKKFVGKLLPGADKRREKRTQSAVWSETRRIKEICDMTGWSLKASRR